MTIVNAYRYPLTDSTLYDNYRAIYLVNDKSRLTPKTFKEAKYSDTIEVGTLYILILRISERRIKSIFQDKRGKIVRDLLLTNVTIIKGFYINIISTLLLENSSV